MITDREIIMAIVDNDCPTKSDVAVLLEGDGYFRVEKAVELYRSGLASKIVFSGGITDKEYGSYPFSDIKPILLQKGIPEINIIHEDKSLNTREQAIEVVKMAILNKWQKLIIVASNEHQYRAYLTFLREVLDTNSGLIIYNSAANNLKWFLDSGWGNRLDRLSSEFQRIERYSALGHLANVNEVVEYQKWKESLNE